MQCLRMCTVHVLQVYYWWGVVFVYFVVPLVSLDVLHVYRSYGVLRVYFVAPLFDKTRSCTLASWYTQRMCLFVVDVRGAQLGRKGGLGVGRTMWLANYQDM